MKDFELTDIQFKELMRLCNLYRREADKCMEANAYLAGYVMIGAALESALIGMCNCYFDEIPSELIPKEKKSDKPKPILDWSLFHILKIARECHWFPVGLNLNDEWNSKKAEVGDWVVILKEFRNLVHASRYIQDFSKYKVTKHRLELCFNVLEVAISHLLAKLHVSLKTAVEKEKQEKQKAH